MIQGRVGRLIYEKEPTRGDLEKAERLAREACQQTEYKDWSHLRDLSWICFLRDKLQDAAKFGKLAYDKAPIESKGGVAKLLRKIRSEQQMK